MLNLAEKGPSWYICRLTLKVLERWRGVKTTSLVLYLLQGCPSWHHIGSDWAQMGQIREFSDQISINFGSLSLKCP